MKIKTPKNEHKQKTKTAFNARKLRWLGPDQWTNGRMDEWIWIWIWQNMKVNH